MKGLTSGCSKYFRRRSLFNYCILWWQYKHDSGGWCWNTNTVWDWSKNRSHLSHLTGLWFHLLSHMHTCGNTHTDSYRTSLGPTETPQSVLIGLSGRRQTGVLRLYSVTLQSTFWVIFTSTTENHKLLISDLQKFFRRTTTHTVDQPVFPHV